jgi:bifunctional DNA-binding transcriptional regulator/antitoxin component of YhaV-PrlF toxin-antitoxin module
LNDAGTERELQPRANARARLRQKAQLTLPDPIRRALHVSEGDEVEFAVHHDGVITVRGYVSVPSDQAWYFTSGQQADGGLNPRPGPAARAKVAEIIDLPSEG